MTEQTEPSMEEILSSIRRILSTEEDGKSVSNEAITDSAGEGEASENDVMELTPDMLCDEQPATSMSAHDHSDMELLSEATLHASVDKLNDLTAHLGAEKKPVPPVKPAANGTLEDLVSSLLRPYLKEWLDANLPALIEKIVKKEVERLTEKVD